MTIYTQYEEVLIYLSSSTLQSTSDDVWGFLFKSNFRKYLKCIEKLICKKKKETQTNREVEEQRETSNITKWKPTLNGALEKGLAGLT